MATTYLTRTFSSPTNRNIFTWSAWVKRQNQVSDFANALFGAYLNSNVRTVFRFNGHKLNFQDTEGSVEILTNRLFRDVNGWYHIVLAVDTTQATASNRVKLYVNGVQETSFSTANYPAQNSNLLMGGADIHYINARNSSGSVESIADMSYSHIHFTDGTAYDPSAFGQYDANGVWTIKTSPSVTYGNNGFFILKDGNSVTDQSGNSNNWTVVGGTLTKTEDNPSNVFATFNPLAGYYNGSTFSNGNNTVVTGTTQYSYDRATLGASSGKYYWEIQYAGRSGGSIPYSLIGISSTQPKNTTDFLGKYSYDWAYYVTSSSKIMNASTETSYGTSYGDNDIIGVAMDLDNYKLYFSKNGTWQNSGDPTSGSTGTGAISIVNPSTASYGIDTPLGAYFPAVSFYDGGVSGTYKANFGNGYFGTTAVASAGTNASGIGIFEYDVPTGYTALSTKGLNL